MKRISSISGRAQGREGLHDPRGRERDGSLEKWRAIFRFEIRYHLQQPLFYLVTFVFSVFLFLSGTGHLPGAVAGRLHLNAPGVILELLVQWIFLILFLMTAF